MAAEKPTISSTPCRPEVTAEPHDETCFERLRLSQQVLDRDFLVAGQQQVAVQRLLCVRQRMGIEMGVARAAPPAPHILRYRPPVGDPRHLARGDFDRCSFPVTGHDLAEKG